MPDASLFQMPSRCAFRRDDERQNRQWNSPSLDRIVPSKGYVWDNVRLVIHAMNVALRNWGEDCLVYVMKEYFRKLGII